MVTPSHDQSRLPSLAIDKVSLIKMAEASKGKAPATAKFLDAEGYEMPW